jgi:hypothetical protein
MKTFMIIVAVVIGFLFVVLIAGIMIGKPTEQTEAAASVEELAKPKPEKYVTENLPEGISVYGFEEKYDKPYGRYELYFILKNETGKKVEYPQVDGDLFVDGKLEGTATGGPGKHLNNLDSGLVSFMWILPYKVPDSVVFRWIQ